MMMMKKKEKDMKKNKLPLPPVFLPDDLIAEILSLLNVKTLVQFKCVSKSWNTLISDPPFVQKHLKKSSQNHPRLIPKDWRCLIGPVQSLPVARLFKNPFITLSGDYCHGCTFYNCGCQVVNSCNELLCFLISSYNTGYRKYWFCVCNPAMRTGTRAFGTRDHQLCGLNFSVGTEPLGVYLRGTIYWLAIENYFYPFYDHKSITHVDQFKIVSLDLSTETYMQFCLPFGFDEVPSFQPTLQGNSICYMANGRVWISRILESII